MLYVVQVQACREMDIVSRCQGIVRDGEEVFTMLTERMERRGGEWKKIHAVTFQKYLFVDTEAPDDFRIRLRSVPGMTRFLTVGDDIVPIFPEEEKLLRLLGGDDHVIGSSVVYKEGDRVTVISGALVGLEGLVRWSDKRQKWIGIEVKLANRKTVIKIGAEFISPSEKKLLSP